MGESYLTKSPISDLVRLGRPKRLSCVPRCTEWRAVEYHSDVLCHHVMPLKESTCLEVLAATRYARGVTRRPTPSPQIA